MIRRPAVTLVEVLVVIGVVGTLFALVIPAVLRLRGSSDRSNCQNNLKNQAAAVFAFEAAMNRLPPGAIFGPFDPHGVPAGVSHGLFPCLLSFLGPSGAANDYRWDCDFSATDNQAVARTRLGVLICPAALPVPFEVFEADTNGNAMRWGGVSNYGPVNASAILTDLGLSEPNTRCVGALPANGTVRMAHVKDGASQTILLAEQGHRAPAWASPVTLAGPREVFPGGLPGGAPHGGGFHAVFCDGAVRYLSFRMNPRTFGAMCTANGGESVPGDWDASGGPRFNKGGAVAE